MGGTSLPMQLKKTELTEHQKGLDLFKDEAPAL